MISLGIQLQPSRYCLNSWRHNFDVEIARQLESDGATQKNVAGDEPVFAAAESRKSRGNTGLYPHVSDR